MKLLEDYRKQFNSFLFILCLVFFTIPLLYSHAQTAQDIQAKINQKGSDISALEKEIAVYQSQLDTLGKQKDSLSGTLKELDLNKKSLDASISVTQSKIDQTNLKIQSLGKDIGTKEVSISNSINAINLEFRQTNEFEQQSLLGTLLSKDNFNDIWTDIDNMVSVRDTIQNNISILKQTKGQLEDTRQVTINAKKDLTVLQGQLLDQKKIVVQNANDKANLLKQTQNSEVTYQKLVQDGLAKKQAIEQQINDYESQLKYILDPSKLPSGNVLSWPLDTIIVTSPFGQRTNEFHYGTDFGVPVGTRVMAMADGVVVDVGNTDASCPRVSYGQWVLIKYNNGLSSTYGHLSLIKSYKGEVVTRGQVVAYSGNTGYSTGPHLHVTVYASDAVSIQNIPANACIGKFLTQPVSAHNAIFDPMKYLPLLAKGSSGGSGD